VGVLDLFNRIGGGGNDSNQTEQEVDFKKKKGDMKTGEKGRNAITIAGYEKHPKKGKQRSGQKNLVQKSELQ